MEYREYEGEFVSVMPNSIFWFNDDACKYISSHIEYLDEHLDVIIALNIIRDVVMEKLEEQFIEKFDKFDFYTNNSLNNFLRDFIGQGQHIKFNKNINEDINIDDLRMIYGILFSKN